MAQELEIKLKMKEKELEKIKDPKERNKQQMSVYMGILEEMAQKDKSYQTLALALKKGLD